ncbi:MAG: type II toxin-antitoxin system RelE/ParE family toxin [Hydrogenophaga sp.]|uniref:type II toxin-antitoxin system RelE/ParE family toxin n=1 Tax=Hydrogenophaga sp. TaxID=1904254 RepID=UPI0016A13F3F|nr:type II toxin-antitoxin system RelE/ParE family toxin [Hydrogenophaga sp.]NIM43588.1 type II toxin-antitoxin system RelE/ParE family toxin [Hydrogenophaga sp.]NIN28657.1 type II toxin-antitoxin system RelE/ParE family toxin [Hydrogenophaga sp.]NIN33116.1 type II toxin-antitoxin system RelE/ParE family toxin [Hydrogenophaga sp.]NIN57791.1 type II toxin-antitoxin system RelE/ParE family toxin [Hydrogenophaga sp.]NIO54086.1 type II toxin-antitoxin system RelE/ParE family toxin [Hydrogenophaga 
MSAYRIEHYLAPVDHQDLYLDWLRRLRDVQAKVAVIRRIGRVELGNFGDHKFCRDGVWELRIDAGPGYRVYYALSGGRVVLLLGGGNKRTQDSDISKAVACWHDWQRRTDDEEQIP